MNKDGYFVTTEWLAQNLELNDLVIIDSTIFFADPDGDLLQSGFTHYQERHIPGAIFADLFAANEADSNIPFTRLDHAQMIEFIQELGIQENSVVVIYDSGPQVGVDFKADSWASRLAWQLNAAGKNKVYVLEGGLTKWIAENRELESGINNITKSSLDLSSNESLFVDISDLISTIDNEQAILLDVLSEDQYYGEIAPFGDDRAGHIPGAVNYFYGSFTTESGSLKSDEEITQTLNNLGIVDKEAPIIVYCGFGVAATYVARILNNLGYDSVSVYDGSLQEWAGQPHLDLEID